MDRFFMFNMSEINSNRKLYFIFLCILIYRSECVVPYNDVKSDFETLLLANRMTNSKSIADVVPKDLTSGPITLYVGIGLYAIMDYDGVSGKIQLIASMKMEWLDEVKAITGTTFMESVPTLFVGPDQIWTPNLVLMSAVDSVERIGDETYKVRFNVSSGYCKWYPRMIINAACTPDMTYYPFDKQTCVLTVTPWNLNSSDVNLVALTNEWNMDNFEKSGIWDVSETSSEAYVNSNTSRYHMDFKITIKRKPLFLALVIVLPVLLLSLLTGFLFLLPPASGERVGFGITSFLSFVVLLQTLMSFMPEVSTPMSILCFYVIVMVTFSVLLSIANVFLLRMYMNPSKEDVPRVFLTVIEIITCKIWRRCPKCPKIKIKCPKIKEKCAGIKIKCPEIIKLKCLKCVNDDAEHYILHDTVHNIRYARHRTAVKETSLSKETFSTGHDSGFYIGDDDDNENNSANMSEDQSSENSQLQLGGSSSFNVNTNHGEDSSPYANEDQSSEESNLQLGRSTSFNAIRVPVLNDQDEGSVHLKQQSEFTGAFSASHKASRSGTELHRSASSVQDSSSSDAKEELTWEYLAQVLDLFFIVAFCVVQTVFTVFYLVPLGTQY